MLMIELSQEIRVLNTTAELIESSVNHMVYSFYKNEIDIDIVTEVKPKDLIERRTLTLGTLTYFNIL